ncbi:hypothetical protein CICLE_v100286921mg, partial [Citrus x clementina]
SLIILYLISRAIKRSNCFHKEGHDAGCHTSNNMYMIIFAIAEIILSQIPNFHELSGLSILAAVMSFAYSSIGLGLAIAKITAFGDKAPGNFLTGFGFYEPFWLVDFANMCIVVHLVGAYQVFCQPIFTTVENWCCHKWPESGFVTKGHPITFPSCGVCYVNMFRVIWRTVYVILTAVIAMLFPFFNSVIGLLGAIAFWPLTVYFPVEMYISRAKIRKFSVTWMWLQVLSWTCFIVTLLAAAGSIQGLVKDLQTYKPFSSAS